MMDDLSFDQDEYMIVGVRNSHEIFTAEAHTDEVTMRHSSWVRHAPDRHGDPLRNNSDECTGQKLHLVARD